MYNENFLSDFRYIFYTFKLEDKKYVFRANPTLYLKYT
jgi:hypothetical protein